jgi:tryptophanyl-tRNA synthetase
MVKFISPIRQKVETILSDTTYLRDVMIKGAEKSRESAKETLELVRQAMGLKYY